MSCQQGDSWAYWPGKSSRVEEKGKTWLLVLMVCLTLCCTDSYFFFSLLCAVTQFQEERYKCTPAFSLHAPILHNRWIGSKDAPLGVLSTDIPLGISLYIITNFSVMRRMPSWFAFAQKAPGELWSKKNLSTRWCSGIQCLGSWAGEFKIWFPT